MRVSDKGTRYFHNPLIGPRQRYEEGYTAGRDAGQLVVSTKTAVLDGDIIGEAFQGVYQTQARQNIDAGVRQQTGYRQSQLARSLAGQLVIGGYPAKSFEQNGKVRWGYDLYATTEVSLSRTDSHPARRQSTWTIPCQRLETAAFPGRRQAERYRSGADHRRRVGIRIGEKPPARGEWRSDRAVCA